MRKLGNAFRLTLVILGLHTGVALAARWSEVDAGLPDAVAGVTTLAIDPATVSTLYARTSGGGLFKSTDGGSTWKALSNIAGVSALALDPNSASTIYAGTSHGVLKSANGGESWVADGLSDTSIFTLIVDPITPCTLYAAGGVDDHINKSIDGGGSWMAISLGLPPALASDLFRSL